ncbi:MAG: putative LPS assembly protein LptD, partial [Bacteroidota bacterium]
MVYQGLVIFIRFHSHHLAANIFTFAATAMMNIHKVKLKYISAPVAFVAFLLVTVLAGGKLHAQQKPPAGKNIKQKPARKDSAAITDTTIKFAPADSILLKDSTSINLGQKKDTPVITIDTITAKYSKDSLNAPIFYHADDSMVMDVPAKKITLYGKKTNAKYEETELVAPGITYDQKNNMITAVHLKDSTGRVIASPAFKQADLLTVSDSIAFNPKTGKGLSKGTYTKQDEMYVYGERIKKIDSSSFFAFKARITTCNLDTPHFAFVSKKIKFINKKFAVTGPVHPEFEGVPLPIILPFGIYPMFQGRHSGLMTPTFTANDQYGIALENLGYYKVISDNWDVVTRGTFYSYGGWTLSVSPRYYRRYRYTGNFNLDIQHLKIGFDNKDPDYAVNKSFKIRWTHSMDSKARPGVTFSANVDAGSTSFDANTPNNPNRNFNNILTSSINYAKVWKDKPFNVSLQANHNQNSITKQVSITLPSMNFNMNTIYPLRRKEAAGTLNWYENIGVALNTVFLNQTNFYDGTDNPINDKRPVFTQITKNMTWGARHSVPITLALPSLGVVQVSPGVSYTETWYQRKVAYQWNEGEKKLDTAIKKGFYTAREMSYSLSASTRIFGMYGFSKESKVKAIRHEIRPSFGISYKPDMNGQYYRTVQTDSLLNFKTYNAYEGNINSPYGAGSFGGISFSLDNNVQMKVRNKKDTTEASDKKISLLDGLSINGSYNFLADSFQLSNLSLTARTNLFDKINITFGGTLDPYQYDTTGRRIKNLVWKDKIFT